MENSPLTAMQAVLNHMNQERLDFLVQLAQQQQELNRLYAEVAMLKDKLENANGNQDTPA